MKFCDQCADPADDHHHDDHEFVPHGEMLALLADAYRITRASGAVPADRREWFHRLHTLLGEICGNCHHWRVAHSLPEEKCDECNDCNGFYPLRCDLLTPDDLETENLDLAPAGAGEKPCSTPIPIVDTAAASAPSSETEPSSAADASASSCAPSPSPKEHP